MTSKANARKKLGQSTIEKLGEYKAVILDRCLSDEKLMRLIMCDTPDAPFKEIDMEKARDMMYNRVFPYRFMPPVIEEQATFLTLGMAGFAQAWGGYKEFNDYQSGQVYFYFFTHFDLMRTDGGVRQDLILAELSRLFNGVSGIAGMGQLRLYSANELWIHNNKFGGYTLQFTITDMK